jgi:ketosteroid isomerase-like protein
MTTDRKLALIRRYYDGCSTGDLDVMMETLAADVVHYFLAPNPGSGPVAGAEHLARYWRKVQRMFDARWVVDLIVGERDQAIIEWTLYWTPPETGERVATRGAESYVFRGGRIAEIRAFYQQRPDRSTELDGFDYAERGYSRLGREESAMHPLCGGAAR